MAEERERFSLSRWSRRKLDARRAPDPVTEAPAPEEVIAPAVPEPAVPATTGAAAPAVAEEPEPPLPPVESLSIESDFRPFLSPKVDEATKRAALRKLFSDPHFNVMDGLDVYIDDYNKPDPMPAGMLEKIVGVYDRLAAERDQEEAAEREARAAQAPDAAAAQETPAAPAASDATAPVAETGDDAGAADAAAPIDAIGIPPSLELPHVIDARDRPEDGPVSQRVRGD